MKLQDMVSISDKPEDESELEYEATQPLLIRQEHFIKHLGYTFRRNVVRDSIEYSRNGAAWVDFTEYEINDICRDFELKFELKKGERLPSEKRISRIVFNQKMAPTFDPFTEFFKNTPWDGTARLNKLAETVKVKDTTLYAKGKPFTTSSVWVDLFKRWMTAAVQCAIGRAPNGVMLLLINPNQGTYKSTWLNNLCPPALSEYIYTGHIVPSLTENVTINTLAEKIILNIDDQLDTIMAKDFNHLKSLITTPFVTNRKSFRRDDKKRYRRANFVGSVNNTEIFRDHQNRRYLSFEIESINWPTAQKIDMNQVWAEAYHAYQAGARAYFDKADEAIINALADHYSFVTSEEEWFSRLFIPSTRNDPNAIPFFPSEVLSIIKRASGLNVFERNLSTALKKLGVQKIKMRVKGYENPRDVYMLQENFMREGERITARGLPGEGIE